MRGSRTCGEITSSPYQTAVGPCGSLITNSSQQNVIVKRLNVLSSTQTFAPGRALTTNCGMSKLLLGDVPGVDVDTSFQDESSDRATFRGPQEQVLDGALLVTLGAEKLDARERKTASEFSSVVATVPPWARPPSTVSLNGHSLTRQQLTGGVQRCGAQPVGLFRGTHLCVGHGERGSIGALGVAGEFGVLSKGCMT